MEGKRGSSGHCLVLGGPHLQSEPEKGGSDGGAVDGPVAPGGGQTRRVVAVHVREEEQPCSRTPAYVPEVHGQRGSGDDLPIGRHGVWFYPDSPPQDPQTSPRHLRYGAANTTHAA